MTAFARYGAAARFATAVAVMIFGSSSVFACPVCFGAEETSMIDGTKIGILVLLAITLAVQGGFVALLFLSPQAREAHCGCRPRQ